MYKPFDRAPTYAQALAFVQQGRSKSRGRALENNTFAVLSGRDVEIVLWGTAVVTIHPDDTYTLRTGGWHTMTTKDRINCYSPARVYSEDGDWYVGNMTRFVEGIRVDSQGRIVKARRRKVA